MTAFREVLQQSREVFRKLPAELARAPLLEQHAAAGGPQQMPVVAPSTARRERLYKKFKHAFATGDWQEIDWRDWRLAPWVLWYGKEIHCLAIQHGFAERLWEQIGNRPGAVKKLIFVYLLEFAEKKPNLRAVAEFITQELKRAGTTSILYPWRVAHEQYALFDPERPLDKLISACLAGDPVVVLHHVGLRGPLLDGGFARALYVRALEHLPGLLKDRQGAPVLFRVLEWSVTPKRLRYHGCQRELIHALLATWQNRAPAPVVQQTLVRFLLRYISDPRHTPQPWEEVRPGLLRTFNRWLTGEVLRGFYTLLEKFPDKKGTRIYRELCETYWQRGHIDEAWMILDPAGDAEARRDKDFAERFAAHYGKFDAGEKEPLLLLRLHHLILSIGGISGKCRWWQAKNPFAPVFYAGHYSAREVEREPGGVLEPSSDLAHALEDVLRRQGQVF